MGAGLPPPWRALGGLGKKKLLDSPLGLRDVQVPSAPPSAGTVASMWLPAHPFQAGWLGAASCGQSPFCVPGGGQGSQAAPGSVGVCGRVEAGSLSLRSCGPWEVCSASLTPPRPKRPQALPLYNQHHDSAHVRYSPDRVALLGALCTDSFFESSHGSHEAGTVADPSWRPGDRGPGEPLPPAALCLPRLSGQCQTGNLGMESDCQSRSPLRPQTSGYPRAALRSPPGSAVAPSPPLENFPEPVLRVAKLDVPQLLQTPEDLSIKVSRFMFRSRLWLSLARQPWAKPSTTCTMHRAMHLSPASRCDSPQRAAVTLPRELPSPWTLLRELPSPWTLPREPLLPGLPGPSPLLT